MHLEYTSIKEARYLGLICFGKRGAPLSSTADTIIFSDSFLFLLGFVKDHMESGRGIRVSVQLVATSRGGATALIGELNEVSRNL